MTTYVQAPTMQSSAYMSRTPMIIQPMGAEIGQRHPNDNADECCGVLFYTATLGCCDCWKCSTFWGVWDMKNCKVGTPCCCDL